MRNRRAFTLVEVMIAVVLSTMISIFLMTLMTKFQSTAVTLTGRQAAAQSSIVALQRLKNLLRSAQSVQVDGNPATTFSGTSVNKDGEKVSFTVSETEDGILWSGDKERTLGPGLIREFEISQPLLGLGPEYSKIYKLSVWVDNPEAKNKTVENRLMFSTIVSERVPPQNRLPDPSWVPNKVNQCPPNCGSTDADTF